MIQVSSLKNTFSQTVMQLKVTIPWVFVLFSIAGLTEGVHMAAHLQGTLDTPNNLSTWGNKIKMVYLKSSSVACQLS